MARREDPAPVPPEPRPCGRCKGAGTIIVRDPDKQVPCPACGGSGIRRA